MIAKIWDWILVSSADPTAIATTVKGFLIGIVPLILYLAPLVGVQLDSTTLGTIIDGIKQFIEVTFGVIGGLVFLFGLIRKIFRTAVGTNLALK